MNFTQVLPSQLLLSGDEDVLPTKACALVGPNQGAGLTGLPTSTLPTDFAARLIAWQRRAGRHGLPWQNTREPYRIWLSEVMLQQTQVATVLAYYPRFIERFPDVQALAQAHEDDVMALWSGLGYYSRARNLHRCAQVVVTEHGGHFPATAQGLQALPGIGASTAAAIAAFCYSERISILDGNVRRVLTRLLAFDGDLALPAPQRALWALAQTLLPTAPAGDDMAAYTQGLMDLGATVCVRSKPRCGQCPMRDLCQAAAQDRPSDFPVRTRTLVRQHENWVLLLCCTRMGDQPRVWLQRRPSRGVWAGLYCPPVFASEAQARASLPSGAAGLVPHPLPTFSHSLTHRELRLQPLLLELPAAINLGEGQWIACSDTLALGLPAPVRQLLGRLCDPAQPTSFSSKNGG